MSVISFQKTILNFSNFSVLYSPLQGNSSKSDANEHSDISTGLKREEGATSGKLPSGEKVLNPATFRTFNLLKRGNKKGYISYPVQYLVETTVISTTLTFRCKVIIPLMNILLIRDHCITKKSYSESFAQYLSAAI